MIFRTKRDDPRRLPQSTALAKGCTFARLTTCLSADLKTRISPCQLGCKPVCAECGCVASAGMHALAGVKLGGLIPLSAILNASIRLGARRAPGSPSVEPQTAS